MSSGGKSGSAQKSLNYYGTVAGALAWRFDWLTAIVSNGNYIWQCSGGGPLDFTVPGVLTADGYVDLTGGLLDPSLIMEGGYLRFYPGVVTATPDPALPNNPAFRDCAGIVAKHIFFGQNSGTAPNIQAIGGAKPDVPTTIVAAADNIVDDRQVNPVAALAEFLLDERGGSLLEAQLDAPSWLAAAHWCAQDQEHRNYSFCSPLITDQGPLRDVVRRLLDPISGFLRWTKDAKLACYIYEWGLDPGGLIMLDARHWTKKPRFSDVDWDAIPTEVVVGFTDRAYEFQNNSVRIPNQRAAQIRGTDDQAKLDRKDLTRSWQANLHGVEYIRRLGAGTATLYVRGPIVAGLQPGDKVKVDTDPEPGGVGMAKLARVDKIAIDRSDEVIINATLDPLVPATAYTPTWVSPLPDDLFAGAVESAPSLAHMLAIPLPLDLSGWPPAVGLLATRPSAAINGFRAYYTDNPANPFAELGVQGGFSARCQLVSAVGSGAGTLRLQLLDGADGPDAYIAADTPGGNAAKAADDYLLAILVSLDVNGRVARDGNGQAVMEFCSIVERSAVTADTHDYTVLRGRISTTAAAWGAGAVAWIIPKAFLVAWQHTDFETGFNSTAYFRLAAFTSAAIDETSPLPETDMVWPSIPTPNTLTAANGTGKAVALNWFLSTLKSWSGEYGIFRATGPGFADWAKIGETTATRFSDHEVVLGTTYQYKIVAITPAEQDSAYSNEVEITVAKVTDGEIDQTQPNDPGAPTMVGSGTYPAYDGRVVSYLMIRVQALPAAGGGKVAATYQELRYRVHGSGATGWKIQDQPDNTGGTEDIRLDDLAPNVAYDIEVQAYSRFDVPSANAVACVGSPITAPKKTDLPNPPASGTLAPDTTAPAIKSDLSSILFGCRVTVTAPADRDVVAIQAKVTYTDTDAAIDYTWGDYAGGSIVITRPVTPGKSVAFTVYNPLLSPGFVRVATIDSTGNVSNWLRLGNANANCTRAVGDMALQDKSNVQTSGVKIGDTAAASVQQQKATCGGSAVYNSFVGGAPTETFTLDISGKGFAFKPDDGSIDWQDGQFLEFFYLHEDAGSSATQVVIQARTRDGSNIASPGATRFAYRFWET